tara:strand:- start:222 stop:341 length:120 start_codon:yes stop_codon:yes gene_type:complete
MTKYTKSGKAKKTTLKGNNRTAAQKKASNKRKGRKIKYV